MVIFASLVNKTKKISDIEKPEYISFSKPKKHMKGM